MANTTHMPPRRGAHRRRLACLPLLAALAGSGPAPVPDAGEPGLPIAAQSSRAVKRPVTGELVAPTGGAGTAPLPPDRRGALRTTAQGLTQEPVGGRVGGARVDLAGRFRSALVARRSAADVDLRCDEPGDG